MAYFIEKQIDVFCLYWNDDKMSSFRTFFRLFGFEREDFVFLRS